MADGQPNRARRGSLSQWLFGSQANPQARPIVKPNQPLNSGSLPSSSVAAIPIPRFGADEVAATAESHSMTETVFSDQYETSAHASFLNRRSSTGALHRTPTHEEERILSGELSW